MPIQLREINMENFRECIHLSVRQDQMDFVAPNVYSLAEAKADGISHPLTIYHNDIMVGFIMYCFVQEEHKSYIDRLMIDKRYQGNGYGRAAMLEVIQRLKRIPECRHIQTSFAHANIVAEKLYSSLGFLSTGEVTEDGKETIVVLDC
jgi:diamine N-acetyltransferase